MSASLEDWLFAPDRLRRLLLIFLVTYYAVLTSSLATSDYMRPRADGYPEAVDFSCFWAVGQAVMSGNGSQVYDFTYLSTLQIAVFGHQGEMGGGHAFVYPPHFLLYLAPLGLLPVFPAMAFWLAATGLGCWAALRWIIPRPLPMMLGAMPSAVAWNIKLGQSGFLLAGLMGLSLALIEDAPFFGGLALGLLTYKPQLGVVFPIVLAAAGQWRVLFGATLSTAVLASVTALLFGPGLWLEFFRLLASELSTMRAGPLASVTLQTTYGFMIWLGCTPSVAKLLHLAVAVPAVIVICAIWRRPVPYALKAASLALGALIATPYLLAYDLTVLALPATFLLKEIRRSGFLPGERLAFLAVWLLLFCIVIPIGIFAYAILFGVIVRRVFFAAEPRAFEAPAGQ